MSVLRREPVAFFGGLQGVLLAVISLLISFNAWNPSTDQVGQIGLVYVAITGFVTFLVRQSVSPVPGPLTGE